MTGTFKNLLVAYDDSEYSKKALETVKELSEKFEVTVTLLHAYEPLYAAYGYHMSPSISEEIRNTMHEQSTAMLDAAKNNLLQLGIKTDTASIIGHPGETIVDTAEKMNASMIIMGGRGLGAVKSILMGSVSSYVLHHSKVPVFVVH